MYKTVSQLCIHIYPLFLKILSPTLGDFKVSSSTFISSNESTLLLFQYVWTEEELMGNLHSSLLKRAGKSSGCFTHRMRLSLGELHFKPSITTVSSGSLEGQVFGTLSTCAETLGSRNHWAIISRWNELCILPQAGVSLPPCSCFPALSDLCYR